MIDAAMPILRSLIRKSVLKVNFKCKQLTRDKNVEGSVHPHLSLCTPALKHEGRKLFPPLLPLCLLLQPITQGRTGRSVTTVCRSPATVLLLLLLASQPGPSVIPSYTSFVNYSSRSAFCIHVNSSWKLQPLRLESRCTMKTQHEQHCATPG